MTAPKLGPAGRKFWDATLKVYSLTPSETALLVSTCRTIDAIEALDAVVAAEGSMSVGAGGQPVVHPAVDKARGQRLALRSLLSALALPDAAGQSIPTPVQTRAKTASAARWSPQTGPARKAAG